MMAEAAYSLDWTPEAVEGLNKLEVRRALDVLNNVMALARSPHPAGFSTVREVDDDTFHLRVETVSVLYRVIGLTVIVDLVAAIGE